MIDDSPATVMLACLPSTGLRPQDIDILVTNCSIFCPTPSLASMLVNHFKFRPDIQGYNLGGMGCGNGVMAVGLIRDLLQVLVIVRQSIEYSGNQMSGQSTAVGIIL